MNQMFYFRNQKLKKDAGQELLSRKENTEYDISSQHARLEMEKGSVN